MFILFSKKVLPYVPKLSLFIVKIMRKLLFFRMLDCFSPYFEKNYILPKYDGSTPFFVRSVGIVFVKGHKS